MPKRLVTISRLSLVVVGVSLLIVASAADALGYGTAGSFGIGQLLLALLGGGSILAGILGKRFFSFYRVTAIVLANSLVLLILLELGAIVAGRAFMGVSYAWVRELPYYSKQEWTNTYWQEAKRSFGVHYVPYVGWKSQPFSGETINFDERGFRTTPGADCREGSYTVFAFGGSTMVGLGSPDWGTIAAYLQDGLMSRIELPVCVVNLAQDGYVSTQSLITLLSQLQSGNIPDLVVFYDGVNEVIAASESGVPGAHVSLSEIASRFERRQAPILVALQNTRLYALLFSRVHADVPGGPSMRYRPTNVESHDLAAAVASTYLANLDFTQALATRYGFELHFFLQPHLAVGKKPLTIEEKVIRDRMEPAFVEFAQALYDNIAAQARIREQFHDISHVLDDATGQIWIDAAGHVTPEGNARVARAILGIVGGPKPSGSEIHSVD